MNRRTVRALIFPSVALIVLGLFAYFLWWVSSGHLVF